MRLAVLLLPIVLGACAIFRSPYEKAIDEYKDKPDLVLDRKANAEFVRTRPSEWYMLFEPVDIAATENDKVKRSHLNRLIQENTSSLCKAMQKNNYVQLKEDSEVQADIDSYLKQLPSSVRSEALLRGRSVEGQTILMCAVTSNRPTLIEHLVLEKKVDLTPKTYHDEDARQLAQSSNIEVQEIFSRSKSTAQKVDAIYKKYCTGNRVKRNMVERLSVTLPRSLKGLALDKAQSIAVTSQEKARRFAKELFVIERPRDRSERKFAALENPEDMLNPEAAKQNYGFRQIKYESKKKTITPSLGDLDSWRDLDALRFGFTFNFPQGFQEESFKIENVGDPYKVQFDCNGGEKLNGKYSDDGGFLGLNENCEFSPGQAIADRGRAWFNVAHKFTTVKESVGSSPNEILFEVTLNLEPLCKYGVQVSDLKSN